MQDGWQAGDLVPNFGEKAASIVAEACMGFQGPGGTGVL